jgi:hypothetical protein
MIDNNGRFTQPMLTLLTFGLKYKEVRMQHVRWHHTNTTYYANTIFNRIGYNPKITESQIANMEEYLSLWFNLSAHEGRHRNEYPLAFWPAWSFSYLLTDAIPDRLNLQEYREGLWESRAYSLKRSEGKIINLVNYNNGLILKTLASEDPELTDQVKSNIVIYVVASYDYETALTKNSTRKGLSKLFGNLKINALKRRMELAQKNIDPRVLDKMNNQPKRSIRMPNDGGLNPDGTRRADDYKEIKEQIKKEKEQKKSNG